MSHLTSCQTAEIQTEQKCFKHDKPWAKQAHDFNTLLAMAIELVSFKPCSLTLLSVKPLLTLQPRHNGNPWDEQQDNVS
jgi:hypothetical protein